MRRAIALGVLALTAMFAISAWAQAQSSTGQQTGLTNPGFEEPHVEEGTFVLVETIPGWKTTDTHFEIWGTGFKEVPAHEGTQFAELNAYINGTLFQDSTGIPRGSVLEFTFAHRGRSGDDTMMLSIGDLGADNALGGEDDTILFAKQYTTGKDAWAVYDSTTEPEIKALGNTVMFAYSAVSTATGELGEGNLLDAANFGVGVVSEAPIAASNTETNKLGMEFTLIPAGTFMMGSPESEEGREGDETQHEVTITRDYFMGVTEVTQSQWQQVMRTTPWTGKESVQEGKENAASYISWNDAVEFCRKLSEQEGRMYRLPTEAEWEYACRGGTTTPYSFGEDASQLEQYAWHHGSKPTYASQVKQKRPNGFGLYDMHGNVWELCQDWLGDYPQGTITDPTGPSSGDHRIMRGGSYASKAPMFRSAYRSTRTDLAEKLAVIGFRVVMVPGSDSGELAMNETEPAPPTRKLINASFEEPRGKEGGFVMAPAMPGWKTTDAVFEIWSTGFEGFEAHDGTQFVELNARLDGTLYQDLTGIGQGAELDFSFAHRGRNGNDTMKLTVTDLGIDNTVGTDDDRVLFVKEYTTGKEAWEVYTNTSEVPIVTLGNTIRFAYTAVYGTGGRGPDKTEGNFLDSVNFGVDVGRPPTRSFTLEEAKQMLIGEWKADRAKTETRFGKLDLALRPLVCEGFLLKFSADNVFQLVTGNNVMSTSYKVEGPDDDNYFQVVTLQDGQDLTEDVRIVDIHHIILKSRSGATPLMFFRHFEPEDNIGRVHQAPVEMVTVGDSETTTGDDKELIITRDAEGQHGAVWTQDKLNFNEDFKISAEVYLGTKDDGADGMAMVFQVTGNDIVSTGSGIGYQGVSPSIAIEFDTYQNRDELNDPEQDHVAIRTNGSPIHTASDFVEVGNLEDGQYHPMTFEWNAAKQTFNLTLDGKQLFKDASIPENGLADQQVYFGFTAATGLYSNLHKVRRISLTK